MRKETTKKRKRVSKADRQRQKLMMVGGAGVLLILIIILAVFIFGSCGTDYAKADVNTVYVLKNGKIVSTDVEAFDEKTYDKDELEAYVKDIIDTYNNENEKNSLKQKSFEVKDDIATLVLEYANADVYENVNAVEFFTGTIKEAQDAGYQFDVSFAKIADGKAITATAEDFVDEDGYKVVIIKSNTKVVIPGDIYFVSTQNISKVEEDWVLIKDGCTLLTEEVETESGFGTEAEGSDDSISEEELIAGEDTIIFDFGEEEEQESQNSQYSDVITYIIYK